MLERKNSPRNAKLDATTEEEESLGPTEAETICPQTRLRTQIIPHHQTPPIG